MVKTVGIPVKIMGAGLCGILRDRYDTDRV
jgi:hypothetical protein